MVRGTLRPRGHAPDRACGVARSPRPSAPAAARDRVRVPRGPRGHRRGRVLVSGWGDRHLAVLAPAGRGFDSAVVPLDAGRSWKPGSDRACSSRRSSLIEDGPESITWARSSALRRSDGRRETADDRLRATWTELRPIASSFARPDELRLLDGIVAGTRPLPTERGLPTIRRSGRACARGRPAAGRRASRSATWPGSTDAIGCGQFADPGLGASRGPAAIPRDGHLGAHGAPPRAPRTTFFIRVPREQTGRFERLWAEGSLDAPLSAYARSPAAGSVARLDEASPGLFDDVEPPAVAAARMEPAKGRAGGPVPPEGGKGRKRRLVPPPVALPRDRQFVPPPLPPRGRPWLIPTVVIVTLVTITVLILRIPLVPTTDTGRSPTVPGSVAIRSVGPSGSSCPVGAVCPSQGPGVTPRASPCPVGVACPSQSPGQSPGQNPCPVGVVCGSPGASPSQSPCPVGAVCGSPGASQALPSASARTAATPTPAPRTTPRPTPRPTPTPKPDRTDHRSRGSPGRRPPSARRSRPARAATLRPTSVARTWSPHA